MAVECHNKSITDNLPRDWGSNAINQTFRTSKKYRNWKLKKMQN